MARGATSSWRARGAACPAMPPCLAAPASVQPSSTWWVTCCRALVSWWPPPSSTSRCVVPAWAGLLSSTEHWAPGGPSPACWRFLPAASRSPCSLQPQCKIADPISTLFFSVFVLGSTLTILRDVFRVLMEGEGGDREGGAGAARGARSSPPHSNLCSLPSPPPAFLAPLSPPPRPFSATWGAAASPQKHCAAAWSQTGGVPTPSCPPGPRTPDPSWGIGLGPAPP